MVKENPINRAGTFLFQINVTRDCNLRCTHCYIHSDVKKASGKMSQENFLTTIKNIAEFMNSNDKAVAEIHVIGGEPTMMGADFFDEVIPKSRELLKSKDWSIKLMLVSNLLSKELSQILPHFDLVSTSYEPSTRFTKEKQFIRWKAGVEEAHSLGIKVTATSSMTKAVINMGIENLVDLYSSVGINSFHLGFFIPEGDGLVNQINIRPTFGETSSFLISAAKYLLKKRREGIELHINPIESVLSAIEKNEYIEDIVCPVVSGSIDINWDGNSASCLEAGGALDVSWSGNVFDNTIKEVVSSEKFLKEKISIIKIRNECVGCEYWDICRGACATLAHAASKNEGDCPGFKKFFDFMKKEFNNGLRTSHLQ